jgi:hypothetical protein
MPSIPSIRRAAAVLCSVLLAACGRDGGGGGAASATRDSAGVRIVENGRGAWTQANAWRIDEQPLVEIGTQRNVDFLLDKVRDAVRLGDGRIVIANGGSNELRFYDAQARHLATVGRKGGGPGEFERLALLRRLRGDSLLADDAQLGRASVFDPQGKFVRSVQLREGSGPAYRLADAFPDGTLLLTRTEKRFNTLPQGGITRDTFTVLRRAGERVDSLATYPGRENFLDLKIVNGQLEGMNIVNYPFMKETMVAAAGNAFYVGVSDAYSIERRRADGTLERLIRRSQEPVPVKGAYLDSLKSVEGATFEGVPLPDRLPAFGALRVDDGGNLWVEKFPFPGEPPTEWEVFDPSGRLLGAVTLPARFVPKHIGNDFVLGVWKTENDVEVVRMYRLRKP